MNYVSLTKFNDLRFSQDPVPLPKLWRWCRTGLLPARRVGRDWFIDLDAFDVMSTTRSIRRAAKVASHNALVDILRRAG